MAHFSIQGFGKEKRGTLHAHVQLSSPWIRTAINESYMRRYRHILPGTGKANGRDFFLKRQSEAARLLAGSRGTGLNPRETLDSKEPAPFLPHVTSQTAGTRLRRTEFVLA